MNKIILFGIGIFVFMFLACPALTEAGEDRQSVTVCAAASLTDVMGLVKERFEERFAVVVLLNLAGSHTLRLQIEKGAPCDIYYSADTFNVERLIALGLVDVRDSKIFVSNSLVVISSEKFHVSMSRLEDLAEISVQYLSIPDPKTVPSGIYAKEALERAGIWSKLHSAIVPAVDVRAALAQVELENIEYGIVYKTDALMSNADIVVLYEVPSSLHSPIYYRVALIKERRERAYVRKFYEYLGSSEVLNIFRQFGFQII